MHRIDQSGHVNNRFVSGNPETGQLPTRIGADWPNAIQEEIATVIEAAGMALDKADNAQLQKAIGKLITSALTVHSSGITMDQVLQAIQEALSTLVMPTGVTMEQVNQAIQEAIRALIIPDGGITMAMVNQAIQEVLVGLSTGGVLLDEWDGGEL